MKYWDKKDINAKGRASNPTVIKETDLTTWPVKKLKAQAISLHSSIYQAECSSCGDILDYDAVRAELESRGYEFQESRSLSITKG